MAKRVRCQECKQLVEVTYVVYKNRKRLVLCEPCARAAGFFQESSDKG